MIEKCYRKYKNEYISNDRRKFYDYNKGSKWFELIKNTDKRQPITEDKVRTEEKTGRSAWLGTAGWYPLLILFGLNMTDELDRSAFSVLLPEIRDHFGLDNSGILWVVAVAGAVALLLTVPIAQLADRSNRVRIALGGAALWAAFSLGTGFALSMWMLVIMRSGAAVGQAVVFPTHNSLLADYYPIASRPRAYSFHRAANSMGAIVGLLAGAGLARAFDWRAPFMVFAVPTLLLVIAGLRLSDPGRGHFERAASDLGVDPSLEEPPPSYAEALRMVWTIRSLRRIFTALPFLAASIVGFASLAALQYAETFHLTGRGPTSRSSWSSWPVSHWGPGSPPGPSTRGRPPSSTCSGWRRWPRRSWRSVSPWPPT